MPLIGVLILECCNCIFMETLKSHLLTVIIRVTCQNTLEFLNKYFMFYPAALLAIT